MIKILLILCLCLSTICFAQQNLDEIRDSVTIEQHKKWAQEMFLSTENDLLINGKIPAQYITKKQLLFVFGTPQKIKPYYPECNYEPPRIRNAKKYEIYFYDNEKTVFYVYDNHADLVSIDFSSEKYFIKTTKITLNQHTSQNDILKVFPKAKFNNYDKRLSEIAMSTTPKGNSPFYYLLSFKKNKLINLSIQQEAC